MKVLYFRQLPDTGPADGLYDRHIEQRTGGVEKRSWKLNLNDYNLAAEDLWQSMRHGFNAAHPVIVGNNLNLMGGAHRIACAIALDCNVHVITKDKPGNAAPWDEAFMLGRGMSAADMSVILAEQERLEDEARRRIG